MRTEMGEFSAEEANRIRQNYRIDLLRIDERDRKRWSSTKGEGATSCRRMSPRGEVQQRQAFDTPE
jgi:hypothetical protein